MVNRYTADKRVRSDDAYTPEGVGGQRPDRSVIVYAQRVREAFPEAPIVIGGIEASLRRIAHLRLLAGESAALDPARRARGSARVRQRRAADRRDRAPLGGRRAAERASRHSRHRVARQRRRRRLDRDRLDASRHAGPRRAGIRIRTRWSPRSRRPRSATPSPACTSCASRAACRRPIARAATSACRASSRSRDDPVLYAHASRILHMESNPGNARALVQRHGVSDVWLNPPPLPLT